MQSSGRKAHLGWLHEPRSSGLHKITSDGTLDVFHLNQTLN